MKKRNLFAEISEGFEALKQEREGKITLRKHTIEVKPAPQVTSSELVALREKMNLSRAVLHATCVPMSGRLRIGSKGDQN